MNILQILHAYSIFFPVMTISHVSNPRLHFMTRNQLRLESFYHPSEAAFCFINTQK